MLHLGAYGLSANSLEQRQVQRKSPDELGGGSLEEIPENSVDRERQ